MIVRNYPKNNQLFVQQAKFKTPNYPCCKRKNWLEFDKDYNCQKSEYTIKKQKNQIDNKSS